MKTKTHETPKEKLPKNQPFLIAFVMAYIKLCKLASPKWNWEKDGGVSMRFSTRNYLCLTPKQGVRFECIIGLRPKMYRALGRYIGEKKFKMLPIPSEGVEVCDFMEHHTYHTMYFNIPAKYIPRTYLQKCQAATQKGAELSRLEDTLRMVRSWHTTIKSMGNQLLNSTLNTTQSRQTKALIEEQLTKLKKQIGTIVLLRRELRREIHGYNCVKSLLDHLGANRELRELLKKHDSHIFMCFERNSDILIKRDLHFALHEQA